MSYDLGDYVDVASRIVEFRSKHPEGSLQPIDLGRPYDVINVGDQTFVVVVAAAYRAPGDPRPGVGMAYEQFPGRTPYTRGSELQNAESSAWGRAIVAALAADTRRGIASAEEVRNRREADGAETLRADIREYATGQDIDLDAVMADFRERTTEDIRKADAAVLAAYLADLKQHGLRQAAS